MLKYLKDIKLAKDEKASEKETIEDKSLYGQAIQSESISELLVTKNIYQEEMFVEYYPMTAPFRHYKYTISINGLFGNKISFITSLKLISICRKNPIKDVKSLSYDSKMNLEKLAVITFINDKQKYRSSVFRSSLDYSLYNSIYHFLRSPAKIQDKLFSPLSSYRKLKDKIHPLSDYRKEEI